MAIGAALQADATAQRRRATDRGELSIKMGEEKRACGTGPRNASLGRHGTNGQRERRGWDEEVRQDTLHSRYGRRGGEAGKLLLLLQRRMGGSGVGRRCAQLGAGSTTEAEAEALDRSERTLAASEERAKGRNRKRRMRWN